MVDRGTIDLDKAVSMALDFAEKESNTLVVVASGLRTTGDGYYESCIKGPKGNLIEITE